MWLCSSFRFRSQCKITEGTRKFFSEFLHGVRERQIKKIDGARFLKEKVPIYVKQSKKYYRYSKNKYVRVSKKTYPFMSPCFLAYENTKTYLTFWENCMSGENMVLEFFHQIFLACQILRPFNLEYPQNSIIICDVSRNMIPFIKLQLAALLKVTLLRWCFSCFLNFTNGTKLCNAW